MTCFAISYQLNKQKDYKPLWDAFAEISAFKAMRDFYLVDIDNTPEELGEYFRQFVDDDDYLFVVPFVTRPYKYRCNKGTKAWLDERFG